MAGPHACPHRGPHARRPPCPPCTPTRRCGAAGIEIAQLHGDGARASLPGLPAGLRVVWVCHATADGAIQTALPGAGGRQADWLLVDGMQARGLTGFRVLGLKT